MMLLLVRAIPPPIAVVGLQLVKALHGGAAPVMARTTTSAQVRTLKGLRRVEGMVPGSIFDGIRQTVVGLWAFLHACTHASSLTSLLIHSSTPSK